VGININLINDVQYIVYQFKVRYFNRIVYYQKPGEEFRRVFYFRSVKNLFLYVKEDKKACEYDEYELLVVKQTQNGLAKL